MSSRNDGSHPDSHYQHMNQEYNETNWSEAGNQQSSSGRRSYHQDPPVPHGYRRELSPPRRNDGFRYQEAQPYHHLQAHRDFNSHYYPNRQEQWYNHGRDRRVFSGQYDPHRPGQSFNHRWDQRDFTSQYYPYRQEQQENFEIVERNNNRLLMKFRKPGGDLLVGHFQRGGKNIKQNFRNDFRRWIKSHCHSVEMAEVQEKRSFVEAMQWLLNINVETLDLLEDRTGPIEPEENDDDDDDDDNVVDDVEEDENEEGRSPTPAFDPDVDQTQPDTLQSDRVESIMDAISAEDEQGEQNQAIEQEGQIEGNDGGWLAEPDPEVQARRERREAALATLATRQVIGVSTSWDLKDNGDVLTLASPSRVVSLSLTTLKRNPQDWEDTKSIIERLFSSNRFVFQGWRAAESCIRLLKRHNLKIRLRDLTFGQGSRYNNLYTQVLKCDGVSPNIASPFFVERGTAQEERPQLKGIHCNEPATEAYRCSLLNAKNQIAIAMINSSLLELHVDALYRYVQTLDIQQDKEYVSNYEIDFDIHKSGVYTSYECVQYSDKQIEENPKLANKFADIPHFDIFCNRLQSQPMVSASQVVQFDLKYTHMDRNIYTEVYGLCYKTQGQRAFICFPMGLEPRCEGSFTIPKGKMKSVDVAYDAPFTLRDYLEIENISVVGKPTPSAQQKQDYRWLSSACTERPNFFLQFQDNSNLTVFVDQVSGKLPLRGDFEYNERGQLYERLCETSIFRDFRPVPMGRLNERQHQSVIDILTTRNIVVAVEGPPGTGKSSVIEATIKRFKEEVNSLLLDHNIKQTWNRMYENRLIWRSEPDSIHSRMLQPMEDDEQRQRKLRLVPVEWRNNNKIKPMILILTRTNASKIHLAEKDRELGKSIVLRSMRQQNFDRSMYRMVEKSCLDAWSFQTIKKTVEALNEKTTMYATIGAFHSISKHFLKVANIQCIIFDESSLIHPVELSSLLSIFFMVPKLVLCGDVKQLPPYGSEMLKRETGTVFPSALDNVVNVARSEEDNRLEIFLRPFISLVFLERSYRLPSNLLSLLRRKRYNDLLCDRNGEHIPYDNVDCSAELLFLQYGEGFGYTEKRFQSSWINTAEANAVVRLLARINDHAPQLISRTKILTFYSAQQNVIVTRLKEATLRDNRIPELQRMEEHDENAIQKTVSTLDAFQGKEDDIIILCPTRLFDPQDRESFVMDLNRLTVACSRARKYMVFMTHPNQLLRFRSATDSNHLMMSLFNKGAVSTIVNAEQTFVDRIIEIGRGDHIPL